MARHAFYRFFVGDYLRDAGHLSLLEHGAYRRLIDLYMVEGHPIDFDLPRIYRLLHATSKEEQQAVQTVIEEFFIAEGLAAGKLRHRRCDREIAWQDALSEAGKEAVKRRELYRKQGIAIGRSSDDKQSIIGRSSSQSQSQSQSQRKEKKKTTPTPPFELPDWVPVPAWLAWEEMRVKRRKPLTDAARSVNLRKLDRLRSDGHNPLHVLEASIAHGWDSFYPLKPGDNETADEDIPGTFAYANKHGI